MAEKKTSKKQSPKNSLVVNKNSDITSETKILRSKTTNKHLIYKYCLSLNGNLNLQKYVEKIEKLSIKDKLIPTLNDKDSYFFINRITSLDGFCCGEMCLFTPDKHQEILEINEDNLTCDISAISPEDISILKGKENAKNTNIKKQFARSIMYFAIKGNHLILAQSFALKSYNLEYYINNLLQKHKLLDSRQYFNFKDQINPDIIENINKAEYIKLFSPLQTEIKRNGIGDDKTYTHKLKGAFWEALKSFSQVIGLEMPSDITLNKRLESNRIKGVITLSFPRNEKFDNTPVIDELANALRNIDNDEIKYEIGLGNKNKLTSNEIKLSTIVTIKIENGLINIRELSLKMIEYFNELREIRRILPK